MRVLITTVTAGAGHLQAAAAVEEAWTADSPSDEVRKVDVLDHVPKLYRKLYVDGYVRLIEKAPDLWGYLFKKTDNHRLLAKVGRWRGEISRHAHRSFARLLREHAPDVVVSTHFLPVEIIAGIQRRHPEFQPFHACVVTDFEAHALWLEHRVDLYCVAAEGTRNSLIARGMATERVVTTGIPIARRFAEKIDASSVRRARGWREDLPVILVLGGGFGMGPVAEVLTGLDQVDREFQVVVVAGRNAALKQSLAAADRRHPTDVLGFVTNMHELMSVASLIISKPGGLTTSEALALGRPLFILNPIPGQEAANSDYLLEHGAAVKVNRVEDVAAKVSELLTGNRLKELSKAAARIGRPGSALEVCRAVRTRLTATAGSRPVR
jgi:processive 1,2-diacylglycerol beta-glucosyltransferase